MREKETETEERESTVKEGDVSVRERNREKWVSEEKCEMKKKRKSISKKREWSPGDTDLQRRNHNRLFLRTF